MAQKHPNTETLKLNFTPYDFYFKIIQYIGAIFLDISYLYDFLQVDIYQSSHIKVKLSNSRQSGLSISLLMQDFFNLGSQKFKHFY